MIDGSSSISNQQQITQVLTNLNNDSQKVVRDVYAKVDKFCNELDQSAKKEMEKKIRDTLSQVAKQLDNLNPQQAKALLTDLAKLGVNIDKLEADLSSKGLTPQTSAVLKGVKQQVDDMLSQLESKA